LQAIFDEAWQEICALRVYDPGALNTMDRAFDKAVKGLSPGAKTDPNIRQNLARRILRLFDKGERRSQLVGHFC
jgi:hypothetical protein